MGSIALELAGWLAVWIATGLVYVWLVRRGITYVSRPLAVAAYFAVATALAAWPFRDLLAAPLGALRPWHGLALAGVIGLQLATYRILRKNGPSARASQHPHIYWLRLDGNYHVSKPFEILFQQTLVLVLVRLITTNGGTLGACIGCFLVVFPALHVPIVPLVGRTFGLYYLAWSFVAAVVFPIVITSRPDGFVFTALGHWLFYLASSVVFTLAPVRRPASPSPSSQPRRAHER